MRKTILFIIFLFCTSLFCQIKAQKIKFDYDDAGNRIARYKTVILFSPISNVKDSVDSVAKPQIEIIEKREVHIYPNPTKGVLKIEIKGSQLETSVQYVLTDMNGKTIAIRQSSEMYYSFDMTSFTIGVYLLQVRIDGKWKSWKIIKE